MNPLDDDDLFDKLDELIRRHQGRDATPAPLPPVPTLTEAIDHQRGAATLEIPLLEEAIEPLPEWPAHWPTIDRRRKLQVALYLRLRQRLDREIEALLRGRPAADVELTRAVQALRDALPAIIRESVEQVLGGGQ